MQERIGCKDVEGWEKYGVNSASWKGISNTENSGKPSVAINNSGNPIVVWHAGTMYEYDIYLRQWNGSRWEVLGGSESAGGISANAGSSKYPSIEINNSGNPVVAWQDDTAGNNEIYIKQWNGSDWEEIGSGSAAGGGISNNSGSSYEPSLAINGSGNPVVAWHDDTDMGYNIYIKQWNGTGWEEIGANSASGDGISVSSGSAKEPSLAINGSGNPVVAWSENIVGSYGDEIYVKQWNGAGWEEIGDSASGGGVSSNSGDSDCPSLAVDGSGNLIVAWQDYSAGNDEICVKRWNGSSWEGLGFSAMWEGISNTSKYSVNPVIAINGSDNPVVAWADYEGSSNYEIYVRQWDGTRWAELGGNSASEGGISNNDSDSRFPTIAINNEGKPVISWDEDYRNMNGIFIKQYVLPE